MANREFCGLIGSVGAPGVVQGITSAAAKGEAGGTYIGTGCRVAMKDPDTGWINYGTYRVQSHEPNVASVMMSPGKHGLIIMRKYHERGQPCPVAVVAGMHPVLMMLGGVEVPYGKNELEAAGGIFGEPVEVINMPKTGLPVPANAQIPFASTIHPGART